MPHKLVKLSAEILCTPLSIAINNRKSKSKSKIWRLKYGVIPNDAKTTFVTPLDKGKPNRHDIMYISGAILKNLFKAFDCKLHNLISAKLAIALKLSFPYSKNRKQCVLINNTYSKFDDIILGVPQGSLVGPLLFNLSINDLFSLLSLSQFIISQLILHCLLGQTRFLI